MNSSKQSWKWLEPPLNNVRDLLLHQTSNLRKQKNNIIKEQRVNNWQAVNQEQINSTRTVKQLKATLKDLEDIKTKVETFDMDKFNRITLDVKKDAMNALKEYQNLEDKIKLNQEEFNNRNSDDEERKRTEEEAMQELSKQMISLQQDNEQYRIVEQEMERIESNINDVNEIFHDLGQLVHSQGEAINSIESNIETAHENVLAGESQLAKAAKYKAGMYPLLGAVVGTCVGGPLGAIAGFKVGSVAAITGSVIGFTGGKLIKDKQGESISDSTDKPTLPDPVHV